jgi:hypothetical protein
MTNRNIATLHPKFRIRTARALPALCLLLSLVGCTTISYPYNGVPPGPTYKSLTGNWVIAVTTNNTAPAPFSELRGYFDEATTGSAAGYPVKASLQLVTPSACYTGTLLVPMAGQVLGTALQLSSFTVNGQFFFITSTVDATSTTFSGTYQVQDGCAGTLASQGTVLGTRYANIEGTYAGTIMGSTPSATFSLALKQNVQGNADGTFFFMNGTASITGLSCFTSGSLSSSPVSTVLGNTVTLFFTDPTTNAQVTVLGTFDTLAKTITVSSISITGGSCATPTLGTATLALQ